MFFNLTNKLTGKANKIKVVLSIGLLFYLCGFLIYKKFLSDYFSVNFLFYLLIFDLIIYLVYLKLRKKPKKPIKFDLNEPIIWYDPKKPYVRPSQLKLKAQPKPKPKPKLQPKPQIKAESETIPIYTGANNPNKTNPTENLPIYNLDNLKIDASTDIPIYL